MQQFSIDHLVRVKITSASFRAELHGPDPVPAVDLRVTMTASNTVLDALGNGKLRTMLYEAITKGNEPPQGELDGVDAVTDTPVLRFEDLEAIKLKTKLTGYTLGIEHGIDEDSWIRLAGCEVNTFAADCKQGGTVDLSFRIQASRITEEQAGALAMMIGAEKPIVLRAPVQTAPIDGSVGAELRPVESSPIRKMGRPVGSKNKPKAGRR